MNINNTVSGLSGLSGLVGLVGLFYLCVQRVFIAPAELVPNMLRVNYLVDLSGYQGSQGYQGYQGYQVKVFIYTGLLYRIIRVIISVNVM